MKKNVLYALTQRYIFQRISLFQNRIRITDAILMRRALAARPWLESRECARARADYRGHERESVSVRRLIE